MRENRNKMGGGSGWDGALETRDRSSGHKGPRHSFLVFTQRGFPGFTEAGVEEGRLRFIN
jgi:hypothetical protein